MRILKLACSCLFTGVVATAPPLWAQSAKPAGPEIVKLSVHPSAIAQPVLRYRLLPELSDQVPGNGALMYLIAASGGLRSQTAREQLNKVADYSDMPLDKLPVAEAQKLVDSFGELWHIVQDAARRQDVQWDAGLREHGYNTLLPYLNDLRSASNVLALQARIQMASGQWEAAERTLQTEFAMARQLNSQPVLIQGLVESGILEMTLGRCVTGWESAPHSPNLYWALSSLPTPFVDLHAIAQWEQAELGFTSPQLALAMKEQLPPDQYQAVLEQILPMTRLGEGPDAQPPIKDVAAEVHRLIDANQDRARQFLAAAGMPKAQLDAMTPTQAVGVYFFREYRVESDEMWKAWELPYAQGADTQANAEESLKKIQQGPAANPLLQTLPSVRRARGLFGRVETHMDALRIIEALRDFAAGHDGRPPEKLEQIANLPIPTDPFTGKPFVYHADGQTAVLEAPYPAGMRGMRFELTFVK